MSPEHHAGRRDHGSRRGETCRRLQVRRRGAGAGPVRRVLPPLSSPDWTRSTEASVRGVGRGCPAARGQTGDLAGPGRAGQGVGPLAGPPGRAGLRPARRRAAQARPLRPAHLHRPGTGGAVHPNRPLPLLLDGPVPAPGHAGAVPHDLRLRPALPPKPACCASPTSTSTPASCRSATRRAAKTGRCPSARRCVPGSPTTTPSVVGRTAGEWFFPGTTGRPLTLGNIDKNFRRFLWQARISHGGPGPRPPCPRSPPYFRGQQSAVRGSRGATTSARCCRSCRPTWATRLIADTAYYLRLTAESYPGHHRPRRTCHRRRRPTRPHRSGSWPLISRSACAAS